MPPADDPDDPPPPDAETETLRRIAGVGGAVQVLFWIFFAFYISYHTNSRGDGMEWLAIMPATLILIVCVAPVLVLSIIGQWITAAAVLAGASVVFNVLLFMQIAREFASKGS